MARHRQEERRSMPNRRGRQLAALAMAFSLAIAPIIATAAGYWQGVANEVASHLQQVVSRYRDGDTEGARRAVTEAYFGVFEGRKLEAAMRMEQGARHTYRIERRFGDLRKAVKRGEVATVLAGNVQALIVQLKADAEALDTAGIKPEVFQTGE